MTQPSTEAPVCYRHTDRETYVRCARCDRPICPDCMNEASVGHQCPECVAEGRRTQRPARTAFGAGGAGGDGYVTKVLIGLSVAALVIAVAIGGTRAAFSGGLFAGSTEVLQWGSQIGFASYYPGGPAHGVAAGEFYRLLTSMFLHYGLIHLLLNMWALWVLGRALEEALGPVRFLALYLLSGLGGSVAVYLFSAPNVASAGASGSIFGLFAGLAIVLRRLGRSASGIVPLLVINLVITFTVPNISIAAHLGGLVTGAAVAAGLAYAPRTARTQVQVAVVGATLLILGVLTWVRTATLLG